MSLQRESSRAGVNFDISFARSLFRRLEYLILTELN